MVRRQRPKRPKFSLRGLGFFVHHSFSDCARLARGGGSGPVFHERGRPSKASCQGLWLLALFAMPFSAAGIHILLLTVASPLCDWTGANLATDRCTGRIGHAAMPCIQQGGPKHSAAQHCRYVVEGVAYTGQRAAIHDLPGNMGRFKEELGRRLQGVQRSGEVLPVRVNPPDPAESVVDRPCDRVSLPWRRCCSRYRHDSDWRCRPKRPAPSGTVERRSCLASRDYIPRVARSAR